MPLVLYYNDMSPPVRAVLLVAKALNIQLELKELNLLHKEHLTEDFLKINPQHTIPTLVDDDFILWDSHAIIGYIVGKYAEDDTMYPKDPKKRAIVDQRLHFDSGILYPRVSSIMNLIVIENEKEIPTKKISAITEAYRLLDTFLKDRPYLSGDCLTIADLCCVATVSTATIITPISTEKYPNLSTWYKTCKNLPYYEEANGVGLNKLDALVELKLGRPRTKDFCE
ncbi:glutathione S-transferase 1 [Aethina tumida]|uniref:glutathione S-transferase 1 n=1 Tax=Aethina tumida TaxID=116153 RepID=UPI00096B0B01|nr:glutathione S-transferase 1 [Aethina tumida]